MKRIILFLFLLVLFQMQMFLGQTSEEIFTQLTWTKANRVYEDDARFGYDKNTFKPIMKRDKAKEAVTILGNYNNLTFFYTPGPSVDPTFVILNSKNKVIFEQFADEMCISSSGVIYISGNTDKMFNEHRKFILSGETIQEVKQPFLYVGISGKLLKRIILYSGKNNSGKVIATLPKNYEVEVLLAEENYDGDFPMNYLVRTRFGLVGWLHLSSDDTYFMAPIIKGLGYLGD